ncbi:hypothetical protein SLEP1_g19641 [Rubroshorea leprosula]|uniref:Uncharacterized protein n=1 Tax=Rubroshorea leprosula TaxID=152421 RepID=A0AAV5JBY2_9ROSI|nr:hypothetical protein SLEP1_g19641 [Rubroshorea leprosula]
MQMREVQAKAEFEREVPTELGASSRRSAVANPLQSLQSIPHLLSWVHDGEPKLMGSRWLTQARGFLMNPQVGFVANLSSLGSS